MKPLENRNPIRHSGETQCWHLGSPIILTLPCMQFIIKKAPADQISCPFQLWNIYINVLFWNHWSAKLQLQLPIKFVIMCPTWMWTNIQPRSFSWPPGSPWLMMCLLEIQMSHVCHLSSATFPSDCWVDSKGRARQQTSDTLWIFKRNFFNPLQLQNIICESFNL